MLQGRDLLLEKALLFFGLLQIIVSIILYYFFDTSLSISLGVLFIVIAIVKNLYRHYFYLEFIELGHITLKDDCKNDLPVDYNNKSVYIYTPKTILKHITSCLKNKSENIPYRYTWLNTSNLIKICDSEYLKFKIKASDGYINEVIKQNTLINTNQDYLLFFLQYPLQLSEDNFYFKIGYSASTKKLYIFPSTDVCVAEGITDIKIIGGSISYISFSYEQLTTLGIVMKY